MQPSGQTVETRFLPPPPFERRPAVDNSFSAFLRRLPLKPHGAKVRIYDGRVKEPGNIYLAVVDYDIGRKNLLQCADAVMRLRGEYLYENGRYDEIRFSYAVDGRPRAFKDFAGGDTSYVRFLEYMDTIFTYANTFSLEKELRSVENIRDLEAGDVFIQKGNPYGHAVIVVDIALSPTDGRKIFLLAQSFMPAQDIQVLQNPGSPEFNPWYVLEADAPLVTPEWTFPAGYLRKF